MNEKKARKIVHYCEDLHLDFFASRYSEADYKAATHYLEALEKAKGLEKALTTISYFIYYDLKELLKEPGYLGWTSCTQRINLAQNALSEYRRVK